MLNGFEYCASLHIEHPQLDPDVVSHTLKLAPRRTHRVGDAPQTPKGNALPGVYQTGCWSADLLTRDGEELAEFLTRITGDLDPAKEFLRRIVDEGGSIQCFIGVFANRCCDNLLPAKLLSTLGQLGIDLRLDFYGPENQSQSIHAQRELDSDGL